MTTLQTKILWQTRNYRARDPQIRDYSVNITVYYTRENGIDLEGTRERLAAFANEMGTHPTRETYVRAKQDGDVYCFDFKVHYARPKDIPRKSLSGLWDELDSLVH